MISASPHCSPDLCVFVKFCTKVRFTCAHQQIPWWEESLALVSYMDSIQLFNNVHSNKLLFPTSTLLLIGLTLSTFSCMVLIPWLLWNCTSAVNILPSCLLFAWAPNLLTRDWEQQRLYISFQPCTFLSQNALFICCVGRRVVTISCSPTHLPGTLKQNDSISDIESTVLLGTLFEHDWCRFLHIDTSSFWQSDYAWSTCSNWCWYGK